MTASPIPDRTELEVGDSFTTASRSVPSGDLRAMIDLAGYTHPLFAGADATDIIPGQLVLALAAGMLESSGRMGADVIALVGVTDCAFRRPIHAEEQFALAVTVTDRRVTSTGTAVLELDQQVMVDGKMAVGFLGRFMLRPQ